MNQRIVIPDARSAIRNPGANVRLFDPLGSGFSLREPQNDEIELLCERG